MLVSRWARQAARWFGRGGVPIWYDPAYRLPITALGGQGDLEPRRADYAAWYLREAGAARGADFRAPRRIPYADLARVHTEELLDSLTHAETLARIFATDPSDVPVDEVLHTVRLACGGTLAAAREALRRRGPTLNLLGGFHHAYPGRAGGLCPVNDVAVAVAALRREGFAGRVVVLDFDAHPPDGTAACLRSDPAAWVGSLSGCDWGPLEGADARTVDESVLPEGAGDEAYLAALAALLGRMPRPTLAFVIAGGDVLAGDHLGKLGLTLDGARRRDLRVLETLRGGASVWLPGGGRHRDAWKVLAGTGLALAEGSLQPIPERYDPMQTRFAWVSAHLQRRALSGIEHDRDREDFLTTDDLEEALGLGSAGRDRRFLGFYTAEGIEYGLFRLGILELIERLGYTHPHVATDRVPEGHRLRLFGSAEGKQHLLVEQVLARERIAGGELLFVHWLTLRNPRAHFSSSLPQLPGQDVPGLGLSREFGELLPLVARRLGLDGVAFRPAWYHIAYAARHHFRFLEPGRQGRFEALVRDLAGTPLLTATLDVAAGRARLDGRPYAWEAETMVAWLTPRPADLATAAAERERVRFTIERVERPLR
ncbi:MAG: histone deacetylase [Planctomycetes bacterium]|nr:histone deacetylase [Planctomycetota bacterium]